MARHVSDAMKQAAALQAARRMIAGGERPMYRLRAQDGRWTVEAMSWLAVTTTSRRGELDAARAAIAEWLDVPPDSFDVKG